LLVSWTIPPGMTGEIINDDGTMAHVPDHVPFCKMHDLMMSTVADLAWYRLEWDDEGSLGAAAPKSGAPQPCPPQSRLEPDRHHMPLYQKHAGPSHATDLSNDLNPSMGRVTRLTPRWSCPTTLFRYFR
jgi:hypothetical protein